jgi:hypothetical protein
MEICPVGSALIHVNTLTDEWMDRMKLIGAFHDCANAPKNE